LASLIGIIMVSCSKSPNPLLTTWNTPFQVPPFDQIKEADYRPAFKTAMKAHSLEIKAIASNSEAPTFENTIAALDYSGELLHRIENVFSNLNGANTDEQMQAIAKQVAPLKSKHYDDINLNLELFKRVKAVYEGRGNLNLTPEQNRLLEKTYKSFVRNGADLADDQKAELRKINEELATLTLKFGDNVLAETNDFKLVIDNEADLAGLPPWLKDRAAEDAKAAGQEGKWVFTLQKSSWIPFLQYSPKRDLREKLYTAWMHLGDNDNAHDNKAVLAKIVSLRVRRAQLLGYPSHAAYVIEENMAKTPESVYNLLNQLWTPALNRAKAEANDMQKLIDSDKESFKLASWDWWYYAEKIRQARYDLSDEALKPYFKLENVVQGLFDVTNKLYGLTLTPMKDVPIYQDDVLAYEVKEADGSHIGVIYMDFFPRVSKRAGAWMNEFRNQYRKDGQNISPVVSIVMNFSKPSADMPSLLTLDEALTLFHEFGHALHGLLSSCTYPSLAGTNVTRDFVELPSQIMENWAQEPVVIKSYAKHYQTGAVIPDELVEKIEQSRHFNQGFITVEYLAAALLDMDYHTQTDTALITDVNGFEQNAMDAIGLISEIIPRYRSTYFQHIFSGEYSAGYYDYIWAEVLDADAFQAFKETSLFDQKTATSFRRNILERGNTEDPMVLYKRFRGRGPEITPLLKNRGLL
jgi:peptidyl-dipeptidase Dcp